MSFTSALRRVMLPRMRTFVWLGAVLISVGSASCLTPVKERWCDTATPCSPGFECIDGHCLFAPDAGARDGGATGGGSGGGGGANTGGGGSRDAGPLGGGGGSFCGAMSCPTGCCFGDRCVTVNFQDESMCGLSGVACSACPENAVCLDGVCYRGTVVDAGIANVGGPCKEDLDCGETVDSFCIPEESGGQPTGFSGGYCSFVCELNPCPGDGQCVAAENGNGEIVNVCIDSCASDVDCRPGYICVDSFCWVN